MSFPLKVASKSLYILVLALTLSSTGCVVQMKHLDPSQQPQTTRAARWMVGQFSTVVIPENDPHAADIQRVVVPIWLDRKDGPWLYVEEAPLDQTYDPIRQLILNLRLGYHGAIKCEVYLLPGDPFTYANAWLENEPLSALSPQQCHYRSGCTIYLHPCDHDDYVGSTEGRGCADPYLDGAYITIRQKIGLDGMTRWVRGHNSDGSISWGTPDGPVVFRRVTAIPESLHKPLIIER